ncbi:MAG: sugar transferase [Phycisphaerales bacterium]|jgi:sugar transferase EpsL|nr:sugar transferase [Phycisphaerales bacterium]MBT7170697.1 sugar transferase [Phycisphaerales bacterium]
MNAWTEKPVHRFLKRAMDISAALLVILLASPLLLVTVVLVRWRLGSPILFRQTRPGLGAKPFSIAKFRTMRDAVDGDGNPLPDDVRLTKFGKLLRKLSIDELPQLWNVLKGEMSLVGPRPLRMHYVERYNARQARRMDMRPGITGWAQIKGRNSISWEEKFEFDGYYIENFSIWLDIKILFLTVVKVFKVEGISQGGQATMKEFMGTDES